MRKALAVMALGLLVVPGPAQARLSTTASTTIHATITEYRPRHFDVSCYAYSNGWVNTSTRRHKLIYAHTMDSYIVGVGRIQPNGRWLIWRRYPFTERHNQLVGSVVRRDSTLWDIRSGGREIGSAVGPDGPEAATALLTICHL